MRSLLTKKEHQTTLIKDVCIKNDLDFKEKTQTYNRERARESVKNKAKYEELLEQINLKLSEK